MPSTIYILIVVEDGLLESVDLFQTLPAALTRGRERWHEESDGNTMAAHLDLTEDEMATHEPGYNPEWGGISRGHAQHWYTCYLDIWVVERSVE